MGLALAASVFGMTGVANAAGMADQAYLMSSTFLRSDAPKIVKIDAATGKVLSVQRAAAAAPSISTYSGPCASGDAIYDPKVPYNQFCFNGSAGIARGSWPYRTGYRSGRYSVSACWTQACGARIGPNSVAYLTAASTGTSFSIY